MIPYDADPSLHPAEPAPEQLDDGCSPPVPGHAPAAVPPQQAQAGAGPAAAQPVLGPKSDF